MNDSSQSPLIRAAYARWRFNWIHPFAGGNGRTSRALAYLVVCIDFGRCVPGSPSIPTRIAALREDYVAALRSADAADAEGKESILDMARLVGDVTTAAIADVIAKLDRKIAAADRKPGKR
jgi:Fic family protein